MQVQTIYCDETEVGTAKGGEGPCSSGKSHQPTQRQPGSARRAKVQVQTVYCDETEVGAAKGGENLRLRLAGVDEDDVQPGFVVCDPNVLVPVVTYFEAQLQVRIQGLGHKCLHTEDCIRRQQRDTAWVMV